MAFEFNKRKRLLIKYKIIYLLVSGNSKNKLINNINRA